MSGPSAEADHFTDRIVGCLIGGAIGDALGAGIEFDSWETIERNHGAHGVTGFVEAYGVVGAITDDTQMSLFTTEGLVRASIRGRTKGVCHAPSVVRHAYLRWLWTQGNGGPLTKEFEAEEPDGWLASISGLHQRRAPGNTCVGALTAGGQGQLSAPPNHSKGCGGVMRAAPAGFVEASIEDQFELGCEIAVLTHGHPSGYLPAGYLAAVIGQIVEGADLTAALDAADRVLRRWDGHAETSSAIEHARHLGAHGMPSPSQLAGLGGGWTGEEALAIATRPDRSPATCSVRYTVTTGYPQAGASRSSSPPRSNSSPETRRSNCAAHRRAMNTAELPRSGSSDIRAGDVDSDDRVCSTVR